MVKKVFLEEIQDLLSEMKTELKPCGYDVKLIGGLHEKGYTSHDIDLDISMPPPIPPNEEIFYIINQYWNEFWEKYHLELDVTFTFRRKAMYKLNEYGFFEYQDDGSLEPTSF